MGANPIRICLTEGSPTVPFQDVLSTQSNPEDHRTTPKQKIFCPFGLFADSQGDYVQSRDWMIFRGPPSTKHIQGHFFRARTFDQDKSVVIKIVLFQPNECLSNKSDSLGLIVGAMKNTTNGSLFN